MISKVFHLNGSPTHRSYKTKFTTLKTCVNMIGKVVDRLNALQVPMLVAWMKLSWLRLHQEMGKPQRS